MNIESLYIHFPWCEHICNYCDFYKNALDKKDQEDEFLKFENYFNQAWTKHQGFLTDAGASFGELKTIFIGGGTPSLWGIRGVKYLRDLFKKNNIQLSPELEFTMEANPKSASEQKIEELLSLRVSRFSVGMQSFDQRFLKALDRIHTIADGDHFLKNLQRLDVNFSIDLMLGLPFSGIYKRDIIRELEQALSYNPKHLSLYILTTKENYCHKDHLPDEGYIAEEYLKVAEFLKSRGFNHYEVSNFSKDGYECDHNLKYWNSSSVAALGPSGTGFINFNNEKGIRYKWKNKDISFSEEELNQEAMVLEKMYLSLRTHEGLELNNKRLDLLANSWEQRNLGNKNGGTFYLNSRGYLVLDSLMGEIFEN